jgi:hypothetical protein
MHAVSEIIDGAREVIFIQVRSYSSNRFPSHVNCEGLVVDPRALPPPTAGVSPRVAS